MCQTQAVSGGSRGHKNVKTKALCWGNMFWIFHGLLCLESATQSTRTSYCQEVFCSLPKLSQSLLANHHSPVRTFLIAPLSPSHHFSRTTLCASCPEPWRWGPTTGSRGTTWIWLWTWWRRVTRCTSRWRLGWAPRSPTSTCRPVTVATLLSRCGW